MAVPIILQHVFFGLISEQYQYQLPFLGYRLPQGGIVMHDNVDATRCWLLYIKALP